MARHGSWNREPKSGFKVVAVDPHSGTVTDFTTGFQSGLTTTAPPIDVLVLGDGSLLITDDGNGFICRVTSGGE